MRAFICFLTATVLVMFYGTGFAEESVIPDLKGAWIMDLESVIHDRAAAGGPVPKFHVPLGQGIKLHHMQFKVTIDQQEGFRFSGFKTSDNRRETITGVIGFDGKRIYMADEDGMYLCTLVAPGKIEQIYLHVTDQRSVSARGMLTRAGENIKK